ncbi:hypothetical protein [Asticcacaulis sp.]|uniref:hypothetical protein n=1 Tax=Asticcacaulis sp. TaxID=1872648 RepID=UPI0031CF9B67
MRAIWTRRKILSLGALFLGSQTTAYGAVTSGGASQVKAFLNARQSGIVRLATFTETEILLLIINGQPIDVHARQNGLYISKSPGSARSVKAIAPVDFGRLLTAAGGTDKGVNGTDRARDFNSLYGSLTSVPLAPLTCPADFAQKSTEEKALIRRQIRQPHYSRYGPCLMPDQPLIRQAFADDPFFDAWTFTHDANDRYLGLSLPGIRAFWSLEI